MDEANLKVGIQYEMLTIDLPTALDEGAKMPERAHEDDAGLDLYSRDDKWVSPGESAVFDTGVHIDLPPYTCALMVAKSGLNTMHDILSTGLIDSGYTGSMVVKLYNHGKTPYFVRKGDKISQLVVLPYVNAVPVLVDHLERESERGDLGFGSTGK